MIGRAGSSALIGTVLTLLVTGCGGDLGAGGRGVLEPREWRVAADEDASPAEIVDAGGPDDVAVSGGRTLVTWSVESGYSEGPQQGAWRLYDESGESVAEGRFPQVSEQGAFISVHGVDDGFVLEDYADDALVHVTAEGETSTLPLRGPRRRAEAGDVVLRSIWDLGYLTFRPSDRTVGRLPRLPVRNPQGVLIDDQGVLWVLPIWDRRSSTILSSPGGTGPWRRDPLPVGRGRFPLIDIAEGGGRVVVPVGREGDDEYPDIVALLTRQAGPEVEAWRVSRLGDASTTRTLAPRLQFLPDGRLVLSGDGGDGAWVETPTGFASAPLPDGEDMEPVVAGDRLFARAWSSHELWVSDDLGETWTEFER